MKIQIACAILLPLLFCGILLPQNEDEKTKEKNAIRSLIERTYIDVLYHGGDMAKLEEGFHPEFNMYYYDEQKVQKRSLGEWLARLRAVRARNKPKNDEEEQERRHEFLLIDVTGYTAVAKFEIFYDERLKYTDYLTLYKTDDRGWQVITKHFTAHY